MNSKEILNKYLQYLSVRGQSKNYYNIMRIWLAYLDKQKIEPQTITQETITEFFTLHNEYSSSTRNQFIKAGRSFYSYMEVENNQWKKIKLLAVEIKIPNYISEQELGEAKKYLITYHSNRLYSISKIEALLDFLYYSGIRKAELLNLKRIDFNLEENTAKVLGKGKKERTICYPEKVTKKLKDYFNSEPEEINAFNITLGQINYLPRVIEKHLGKKVYTHLFRHSFARNLIYNKGVDINTVSKLLGHSSLTTTMIYINPDEKTIKENYKKLVG